MTGSAHPRAPRCSAQAASEPLAGTAPTTAGWVALEQPGPWGPRALVDSRLDPGLGRALTTAGERHAVTVILVRRPGRHVDVAAPRHWWAAGVAAGRTAMWSGVLADPVDLLRLDLAGLVAGHHPGIGTRDDRPLLLVCTNGRRDLCCAVTGRPLAEQLAGAPGWASRVWEASHLGGHRFAPTAVLLPWGHVHGRLDPVSARAVLDAGERGVVPLATLRGRSCLTPPEQVADVAVRTAAGVDGCDELSVRLDVGGDEHAVAVVTHRDGRAWRVALHRRPGPARPESCGRAAAPGSVWIAAAPEPVTGS